MMQVRRRRDTDFYDTPDYANARGIAEALRGSIKAAWHNLHYFRREAAVAEPGSFDREHYERCEVHCRQQLSMLLRIRREGIRG